MYQAPRPSFYALLAPDPRIQGCLINPYPTARRPLEANLAAVLREVGVLRGKPFFAAMIIGPIDNSSLYKQTT